MGFGNVVLSVFLQSFVPWLQGGLWGAKAALLWVLFILLGTSWVTRLVLSLSHLS